MPDIALDYSPTPEPNYREPPAAADPYAGFSSPATGAAPAPPPAANDPYGGFSSPVPKGGGGDLRQIIPPDFHGLVVDMSEPRAPAQPKPQQPQSQPQLSQGGIFGTPDNPSMLQSGLSGTAQGATLNWAPDLHGLVMAGGGDGQTPGSPIMGGLKMAGEKLLPSVFGSPTTVSDLVAPGSGTSATDRYTQGVADARAKADAAQKTNPGSYLAGELAGGIATVPMLPAMAPFKVAEAAPLITRALPEAGNLLTAGAGYGGIAGAGGAEGGLENRIAGAVEGAGTGAVLGPVVGTGLRAAGKVLAAPISHIKATFNPQGVADRVIADTAGADVADLGAIADRMEAARAQGQPLTLADAAGPNTQATAGSVARFPGPARAQTQEFLNTRQIGDETTPSQGDRITGSLTDLVGGDQGSLATAKGIVEKRGAQVKPLYERGDAQPIDYGSTAGQRLTETLDRIPDAAKAKANQILQISGEGGQQPIWHMVTAGPKAGSYELSTAPNVRQWRYIRQGLDAAIDGDRDQFGRVGTIGHALQGLRGEISSALHEASPLTAKADQIFAGESKMLDALREGKKAFQPSTTPEQIAAYVKGLSPGEAEMFRLGAANALKEKLAGAADGVNKARLAYGSPGTRAKLEIIAPDETARAKFAAALKNETDMFATRAKATGNSATAERLNEDGELIGKVMEGAHVGSALLSGKASVVISAVARHMAKVDPAKRAAVLSAIRDIALNPSPETVRAFAARIQATPMSSGVRRSVIGAVMNGLPRGITTAATAGTGGQEDEGTPRSATRPQRSLQIQ